MTQRDLEQLGFQKSIIQLSKAPAYHNGTISFQKLNDEAKFYMSADEIEMIKLGQLADYLEQFDTASLDDYLPFGSIDLEQIALDSQTRSLVKKQLKNTSAPHPNVGAARGSGNDLMSSANSGQKWRSDVAGGTGLRACPQIPKRPYSPDSVKFRASAVSLSDRSQFSKVD